MFVLYSANANAKHNSIEKFVITQEIYNIDSYIETHFFGIFTPIKGQYLAFNNLTVTLTYEIVKNTKKPFFATEERFGKVSKYLSALRC